jgi:hypothetical protein
MVHPYHHSLSSMRKWGGEVSDYLPLHSWFDVIWTVNPPSGSPTVKAPQSERRGYNALNSHAPHVS